MSVWAEVTTWVTNEELLPPPCSAWRMSAKSSVSASRRVYRPSSRMSERKFSDVDLRGSGLRIISEPFMW